MSDSFQICGKCGNVGYLEDSGQGSLVCTFTGCGHTLDSLSDLTVDTSNGVKVGDDGSYFNPNNGTRWCEGNAHEMEKAKRKAVELCDRAGFKSAESRAWEFLESYLLAKKTLATFRNVMEAAKVMRVRAALRALRTSGHGKAVEWSRVALQRHIEPHDPGDLGRAQEGEEEEWMAGRMASEAGQKKVVPLRHQLESIVSVACGEDEAGFSVGERVREVLDGISMVVNADGLVRREGRFGRMLEKLDAQGKAKERWSQDVEKAMVKMMQIEGCDGKDPKHARHISFKANDESFKQFYCSCLLNALGGDLKVAADITSAVLSTQECDTIEKATAVWQVADAIKTTIMQARQRLPVALKSLQSGSQSAILPNRKGLPPAVNSLLPRKNSGNLYNRVAGAVHEWLKKSCQGRDKEDVSAKVLCTVSVLLGLAEAQNIDSGRNPAAMQMCVLKMALTAHGFRPPADVVMASMMQMCKSVRKDAVKDREKELSQVLEVLAKGMPFDIKGDYAVHMLCIFKHAEKAGQLGLSMCPGVPPGSQKKRKKWAEKVNRAVKMAELDRDWGKGGGRSVEMGQVDFEMYEYALRELNSGRTVVDIERYLVDQGRSWGRGSDHWRSENRDMGEELDEDDYKRGGKYIYSQEEASKLEKFVGDRFEAHHKPKNVRKRVLEAGLAGGGGGGGTQADKKAKSKNKQSTKVNHEKWAEMELDVLGVD